VPERLTEYRRIAVFGGVYSNAHALRATLDDAHARAVDAVFCLGDLGGFGPHPDRVYPLLREAGVQVLQGNYDASLTSGAADCGCGYTDPRDNHFARISYVYTLSRTSAANRAWLGTLPPQRRLRLGEHRVRMCHGSPRMINEFLWESTTPSALLRTLLREEAADVLLCTHTGIKWHRALGDGTHAVNVGVIGRPENDGTRRVWYTIRRRGPISRWSSSPCTTTPRRWPARWRPSSSPSSSWRPSARDGGPPASRTCRPKSARAGSSEG
jgi:hypothetical protein